MHFEEVEIGWIWKINLLYNLYEEEKIWIKNALGNIWYKD